MADGSPTRDGDLLNQDVLVLNQDFLPLNVCRARRALLLLLRGKAEVLERNHGEIHGMRITIPMPSVIRLAGYIRRPLIQRRLTRREVFARDRYACQYCGKTTRELTLDHVVPRYKGGGNSWKNVVSACIPCNHRKAGRTPEEAQMRLLLEPGPPPSNPYYPFYRYLDRRPQWGLFIRVDNRQVFQTEA